MNPLRLRAVLLALEHGDAADAGVHAGQVLQLLGLETRQVGKAKFYRAPAGERQGGARLREAQAGAFGAAGWRAHPAILAEVGAALRLVAEIHPAAQVELRLAGRACMAELKLLDGRRAVSMREDRELPVAIVAALLRLHALPTLVAPPVALAAVH